MPQLEYNKSNLVDGNSVNFKIKAQADAETVKAAKKSTASIALYNTNFTIPSPQE